MLPLWSTSATTEVEPPAPKPWLPRSAGRAIASARAAIASVLSSSSSHWRSRRRRISLRFTSARNSSEGNAISRGRLRVKRWMRMGIAAAASPMRKSGLRKLIGRSQQLRPFLEVGEQGPVEGGARVEPHVVDAVLAAGARVLLAPRAHPGAITLGDLPRLGGEPLAALHVDEGGGVGVGEVHLVRVEDVEHDHLVAAVAEVLEPEQHLGGRIHEIREQHD